MPARPPTETRPPTVKRRGAPAFSEAPAWAAVGEGWRPLSGGFRDLGYSIEWHDFTADRDLDWSRSFHPDSVEICLNLSGCGEVRAGRRTLELTAATGGFYAQNGSRLTAIRRGGERHQFVTVELSLPFLDHQAAPPAEGLHSCLDDLRANYSRTKAVVSTPIRLTSSHLQLVMSLRHPPVYAAAQPVWYRAKALEVAAALLYQPLPGEELFCQRVNRLNHERVQKVIAILKQNIAEPPSLEEIGRRVGCSHFYLSRIFTQEMGKTLSAYLRDLRMERAAELLRQGRLNVTQVALEVGYASLSHFTVAFRETFACCPGLYPLKTPARKSGG